MATNVGDNVALRNRRPLSIKTARGSSGKGSRGDSSVKRGREDQEMAAAAAEEAAEEPMSPAGRLFHEPHFNCYIIAIMGSGTPIDLDAARAGLRATLIRHPRFSSIQMVEESEGKKARWVRTEVNVDDHLIIPDLGPTASPAATSPDQAVEDYVSSLSLLPAMDMSRPLWEFHILNFPTSEAAAVAVLRVHHSLGDGTSLISLLLACTRKAADPSKLPTLPEPPRRRSGPIYARASASASAGGGLFAPLRWAVALLVLLWHTAVDAALFVATVLFLRDTPTPFNGGAGDGGGDCTKLHARRRFVHRTVSLDDIKHVKDNMNCTVNDVLIGVTSAGLSRYLQRKYGEEKLPKNIRVRSTLLVNIRPTPGIHALAEMMDGKNEGAKWGNWLGYILLPFPIAMYEDPLDYVRKGKANAERKKSSLEAIFTFLSGDLFVKLFGIKAAAALSHRVLTHTTMSFSNVVGPVEEIEFYGHPLVYLAPSVYGHPHALTVNYQSYMNTMKIVLAVDDSVIPDPHQMLDDLAESLKLIKDATKKKEKMNL